MGLESKEGAGSCFWIELIKAKSREASPNVEAVFPK